MVYGDGLEKRHWLSHPVPPDTVLYRLAGDTDSVYIWLCHPVLLGANQYVSKMLVN